MTKRLEFSPKIKDQAAIRAAGQCEKCGMPFGAKRPEYDHRLPDALGGKPTLANCWVLCAPCHREKTGTEDIPRIRKSDRQRKAAVGAKAAPSKPIQSAGFQPVEKPSKIARVKIDKSAFAPLENNSQIARMFRNQETQE